MIKEGAEDLNCNIEEIAWPYLDQALIGDISFFYTEEGFDCFVLFLIYQLFRTKRFLQISKHVESRFGVDGMRRICSCIRYPTVIQIHGNLLKNRDQYDLVLIDNTTKLEFITGDQPLVNLDTDQPPKFFDLFYPISPKKALFLSKKGRINTDYPYLMNLTCKDVDFLNRKICSVCINQVYASNEDILVRNEYHAKLSLPHESSTIDVCPHESASKAVEAKP